MGSAVLIELPKLEKGLKMKADSKYHTKITV